MHVKFNFKNSSHFQYYFFKAKLNETLFAHVKLTFRRHSYHAINIILIVNNDNIFKNDESYSQICLNAFKIF